MREKLNGEIAKREKLGQAREWWILQCGKEREGKAENEVSLDWIEEARFHYSNLAEAKAKAWNQEEEVWRAW